MQTTEIIIYYPYNKTFNYYGEPRAGIRAQQFIDERNKFKGGHWVLHTGEQYDDWYQKNWAAPGTSQISIAVIYHT